MDEEKICHWIIPVKSDTKGLVFLMTKSLKEITNHSVKLEKGISQ